jgi:chorismate-pyruvate lyase
MSAVDCQGLLHPLDQLMPLADGPLRDLRAIDPADIPRPYRELLVHTRDMTPTLEGFHGDRIELDTLRTVREPEVYLREVVLRLVGDGRGVEHGASRIHLNRFPEAMRDEILDAHTPLGTLMASFGIDHVCRPTRYVRLEPNRRLQDSLDLKQPVTLYGRQNVVSSPTGESLYEVMEILAP